MKKDNAVEAKAYKFAVRIVKLYKHVSISKNEYVLSKQLLRSGTSIGAQIKEAQHAQSKADFLNKMNIALKEANETEYWIQLLNDTNYIAEKEYISIQKDCQEIIRLLVSIVSTTKTSLKKL